MILNYFLNFKLFGFHGNHINYLTVSCKLLFKASGYRKYMNSYTLQVNYDTLFKKVKI